MISTDFLKTKNFVFFLKTKTFPTKGCYREKYLAAIAPPHEIVGGTIEALSGVGYMCPLSRRLGGLRERPELRSGAPVGNTFWRILKTTESSFLRLYADALS